jgi:hypothetical protein
MPIIHIGNPKDFASKIAPHPDGHKFRASYYEGAQGFCGPLNGPYVASNYWPCGTRLEITYKNKMEIGIVKDRMGAWPAKGCHCIDLSKNLFKKFANTSLGVIEVRVRKKTPATGPFTQPPPTTT